MTVTGGGASGFGGGVESHSPIAGACAGGESARMCMTMKPSPYSMGKRARQRRRKPAGRFRKGEKEHAS